MTYDTQPITDAAGEAFNAALEGGSLPEVAFEAGAEAATQVMGDMGAPPQMIEDVITEARGDFESGMNEGMSPGDAFEAIDTGGLGPDMGAIADAAHEAFEEAVEGGASPTDAFEAAAAAAGEECANQGIPPEMHEEATASLREDFNEAIEAGVDPMEAFDALEPPGMDEGMGAEYAAYDAPHLDDPMTESVIDTAAGGVAEPVDGGPGGLGHGEAGPMDGGTGYGEQPGGAAGTEGPGGEGYAPPPGEYDAGAELGPMNEGLTGTEGPGGEGYPPPPDTGGMDALETAMGGGEEYAPPPEASDVAMDSAMTQSANEDYVPPPPPTDTGGMDAPPPPPADTGGMDDAPPPPDDPGAIG